MSILVKEEVVLAIIIVLVISLILNCINFIKLKKYNSRIDKFLNSSKIENIEEVIYERFNQIDNIGVELLALKNSLEYNAFKYCSIVKYDANTYIAGNLSFSLCLLNENKTGFILTSLYTRDGSYVYARNIINGESDVQISKEEKEALELALSKYV